MSSFLQWYGNSIQKSASASSLLKAWEEKLSIKDNKYTFVF